MFVIKRARTCYLLCKTPGYYHSTSKTHMNDRIFKLSPIRASVIYQIPLKSLNSLNSMEVLFHLGKTSIYPYDTCRCGFKNLREEGPRNAKSVVPPSSAILFFQFCPCINRNCYRSERNWFTENWNGVFVPSYSNLHCHPQLWHTFCVLYPFRFSSHSRHQLSISETLQALMGTVSLSAISIGYEVVLQLMAPVLLFVQHM